MVKHLLLLEIFASHNFLQSAPKSAGILDFYELDQAVEGGKINCCHHFTKVQ